MTTLRNAHCLAALIALGSCATSPSEATGALVTFTVDQTQSVLTIGGSFFGFSIEQQGSGSLAAHYSGTITAEVTDSTITFMSGSFIAAVDTGTWQPDVNGAVGSAPANYGGQANAGFVSGTAAFRDLMIEMVSGALPVTDGTFPAQSMVFSFPSDATSAADYRYTAGFASGNGRRLLAGETTNNIVVSGSITNDSGNLVLVIPAEVAGAVTVVSTNDLQYRLEGQIVATAQVPLQISRFLVTADAIHFTISTQPDVSYTILGLSNLVDSPTLIDQFTATNQVMERSVSLPDAEQHFFWIRQD